MLAGVDQSLRGFHVPGAGGAIGESQQCQILRATLAMVTSFGILWGLSNGGRVTLVGYKDLSGSCGVACGSGPGWDA